MKKFLFLVALFLSVQGASFAGTEKAPRAITEQEARLAEELTTRLEDIRAIDKAKLSAAERRELRREVREIKQQLRDIGGGVYLSAAALIIIVLLLILLL